MIRAEEILGEVRVPKWRGPKLVVRKLDGRRTEEPDEDDEIVAAPPPRRRRSKSEAERERPLWDAVGAAMHSARDRNKWSLMVTGGKLAMSDRMLCDYERGVYAVPEHAWELVEHVLGVDIKAMVEQWRAAQ